MMRSFTSLRSIRYVQVFGLTLVISLTLAASQLFAQAQRKEHFMGHPTFYRTTQIDGLSIFYREAGPKNAATILLLHGLPSSSRMFERSEEHTSELQSQFHLVCRLLLEKKNKQKKHI